MNKEQDEVMETINMFYFLDQFIKSSSDYKNSYIKFQGYDLNCLKEGKFYKHIDMARKVSNLDQYLQDLNDAFDFQAAAPQRESYLKMLKIWRKLSQDKKENLDVETVRKIAAAGGLQFI